MRRVILALFLAPLPAVPGIASDDRLARLMSEDFARQAEEHLASCDREHALIAALRVLPKDPDDEDFERFDQAALLMFSALASRAIRIDRPPEPSPDRGLIAVFGSMDARVHLFDGLTGAPNGFPERALADRKARGTLVHDRHRPYGRADAPEGMHASVRADRVAWQ